MNSNVKLDNIATINELLNSNNGDSVSNGDTTLHRAAFRNLPDVMDVLVNLGVPIDAVNKRQESALHVAVKKTHLECVKSLVRLNCDVNLQDVSSFTPVHYAIIVGSAEILDALCSTGRVDYGSDFLLYATVEGNADAVQYLMRKAPHLVDVKEDNSGFAPLHLAADHGHRDVAVALLSHPGGRAQINLQANLLQTPLHLATSGEHWSLVEVLLQHSADIAIKDEEGNTALHLAINQAIDEYRNKSNIQPAADAINNAPQIHTVWQELRDVRPELALFCFLVSQDTSGEMLEGAANHQNQTPFDLLKADSELAPYMGIVESYKGQKRRLTLASQIQLLISKNPDLGADVDSLSKFSQTIEQIFRDYEREKDELKREIEKEKINTNRKVYHILNDSQRKIYELEKQVEKDKAKIDRLQMEISSFEEATMCKICMDKRTNVAFLCGHGACDQCAASLKTCHTCRQIICKMINLY